DGSLSLALLLRGVTASVVRSEFALRAEVINSLGKDGAVVLLPAGENRVRHEEGDESVGSVVVGRGGLWAVGRARSKGCRGGGRASGDGRRQLARLAILPISLSSARRIGAHVQRCREREKRWALRGVPTVH